MADDVTPVVQRCGVCNDEWLTEQEYLNHVCPQTGFTPQQSEHLGPEFTAIQAAALQRGLETLQAQGADTSKQESAIAEVSAQQQ